MSKAVMQQALSAFEAIMFEKDAESCQIIAKNARYSLREALAQPEQEPFKPDWVSYRQGVVDGAAQPEQTPVAWVKDGVLWNSDLPKKFTGCLYTAPISEPVKERISEPLANQEPVAWVERDGELVWHNKDAAIGRNLYTAPPSKPWVGLTFEEIKDIWINTWKITEATDAFAYNIEAKLKEKNT